MKGCLTLFLIVFLMSSSAAQKVVLQLQWLPQFQFAGYYMAKEKGFYADAGLAVDIKPMRPGLNVEAEVLSGRAQYGVGRSSLLIAYDRKQPVVAMASILQSSPMVLLVRKDSGIRRIEDLRGKRVMLTDDAQSAAAIQAMLRNAGMTQEDLVLLPHSFDYASLERNETDAMAAYTSNEPFSLSQDGVETYALNPKHFGFDFYSDILFTSKQEVGHHPERTRRFYEASLKGWRYAFEHSDETAKIMYEKYNPQHKSLAALRFESKTLRPLALDQGAPLGFLNFDRLNAINQTYTLLGLSSGTHNLDGFVYHPERLLLSAEERAWIKAHPVIRIGVDPAWPPIEFLSKNGTYSGVTSGYMRRISEKLGLKIELEHYDTWAAVQEALRRKEVDVATAMMNMPQRRQYAMFTRPFLSLPMVIVGGESFKFIGDLTALEGKRVAVVRGYGAEAVLEQDFPGIELVRTDRLSEALELVAYGKADAAVDALAVVGYLIAKRGLSNLRVVGQTPYRYDIAMGVRSDWPELRRLLQKALDSIDTQEREAIYRKWVPTVYEYKMDYALLWKVLAVIVGIALLFGYKYIRLDGLVRKRTRELEELNATLHERVEKAVEENRSKERMMIQQAKMATIGEMIESIAHQWRQPLNIMGIGISNLDLKRQLGTLQKDELDALIEMVQRQVAYMSQTIDDFRNFFKKDKKIEHVQLLPLVDEVRGLVEPALRQKKIELEVRIPEAITCDLYPNELKQVILNLVSNAKDVLVQQENAKKRIVIRADELPATIRLEVQDNGGGVPPSIKEKIFEPYYTTKFESQGTGIGLYMSKIILERHLKGTIHVENRNGGACFVLNWPKQAQVQESVS